MQGACEYVHTVDNAVNGCDCGMGEMMISEFNCVGDLGRSGGFFHNFMASVVLERYTNIPAVCTTEVPKMSCLCLFVCNYVTAKDSDGCSVIIERSVEVRPCGSRGVEGCLQE